MKLIDSSVEYIKIDPSLKGIFRLIEQAARICYKSVGTRYFKVSISKISANTEELIKESKGILKSGKMDDSFMYLSIPDKNLKNIPENFLEIEEQFEDSPYYENLTAEETVQMLIDRGHTSPLEHGTVYLYRELPTQYDSWVYKYEDNPYSKVNVLNYGNIYCIYITTNYRVIYENKWEDDLKYLSNCKADHEERMTYKWICSRSVAQEATRHRTFSFSMESQRFCNYSKDRFNKELTFVIPRKMYDVRDFVVGTVHPITGDYSYKFLSNLHGSELIGHLVGIRPDIAVWYNGRKQDEKEYFELLNYGWLAQDARDCLPNACKTEIFMTAFSSDWAHFMDLRLPKNAHPDIRYLAEETRKEMDY